MLKKILLMVIGLFLTPLVFAGQGMYLHVKSYVPRVWVSVLNSNCLSGTKDIIVNRKSYLEVKSTCLEGKVKISINENKNVLAQYAITVSYDGSYMSPHGLLTKSGKSIVATLYPHSGLSGTQDKVTISIANNEDDWMKSSSQDLGGKLLHEAIIPGSHDTGTQGITDHSQITSDMDHGLRKWINLDPLKIEHLKHWSVTQNLDVKDQLYLGIRYLDLRLCKEKDGTLVTCHSISGSKLETILNQVADFLNDSKHDHEIIILDFNHVYDFNNKDLDLMYNMIRNKLGTKIAESRYYSPNSLISNFWRDKKQVIVIVDNAIKKYLSVYWSGNSISSPWPNKQNPEALEKYLETNLAKSYKYKKFYVLQTQETPSTKNIIDGFNPFSHNPDSLFKMTTLYKDKLETWLNRPEIKQAVKDRGCIVIEDFTDGIDLTEYAKALNRL